MPWLAQALMKFCVVMVPLLTGEVRYARYCSKVQELPVMHGWLTCWCS
jgi:hypothetical protein